MYRSHAHIVVLTNMMLDKSVKIIILILVIIGIEGRTRSFEPKNDADNMDASFYYFLTVRMRIKDFLAHLQYAVLYLGNHRHSG